ncbi:MAG: hypothetical protein M3Y57_15025 [Acidobacteriota bacterium]|nr:hypothetical protein [Acidobacteriota bacterium]
MVRRNVGYTWAATLERANDDEPRRAYCNNVLQRNGSRGHCPPRTKQQGCSGLEKHWATYFDDLKQLIKFRFDTLDRRFDDVEKRISDLEHTKLLR